MVPLHDTPPRWLKWLVLSMLALGIFFRWVHLDQKPYWHDETYTSIRISGHLAAEAVQTLFTGQAIGLEELRPFQRFNPEHTIADMVHSLATEDPHHPPLFYLLERPWVALVGSSVWGMRSLPALLSLLEFPALFWLCHTVFRSRHVAWVALGLFAVSPIYVRYAQEARQYSLWILLMFLSSGWLFLAVENPHQRRYWGLYSLTTVLGLYCHVFHGLVLAGQVLYGLAIVAQEPLRGRELWSWTPTLNAFLLSLGAIILAFSPWIWVIVTNWQRLMVTTEWANQGLPLESLLTIWGLHLCRAFLSWHPRYDDGLVYLGVLFVGLLAIAFYRLCRSNPLRVWLLPLSLMIPPVLVLAIPDVLWGGQRSVSDRYFFSTYVGLSLGVFYLLGTQFSQNRLWRVVTVSLLVGGAVSCGFNAQAETWWRWSEYDVESGRMINQASQPLVVSEMTIGEVLALSYQLKPATRMVLLSDPDGFTLPVSTDDVFFFNPSERLRDRVAQQNRLLELVYQFQDHLLVISLYRLKPVSTVSLPSVSRLY